MGFFGGLDAEAYDRTYSDRELFKRMLNYFRAHTGRMALILIGVVLQSAAAAAAPILISSGIDTMSTGNRLQNLAITAGSLLALGCLVWVGNWIRRRITARIAADVMLSLRIDAFHATIDHDLSFFDEFSSGRIVTRITSDTQEFAKVALMITDIFSQIFEAVILFIVLFRIDTKLSLLLLGMLPVLMGVSIAYRRLARKVTRRGMRAMANVNALIKEAVTGIAVAKNFRQEAVIYREFQAVNQQSYHVNIQRGLVLSLVFPSLNALGGMATAILVYAGGLSAAAGAITIGAWYLFTISLNRFWFPVLNLSAFWSQIQQGLSAAERVFALIDAEPAVRQHAHNSVATLRGEIEFRNLNFHYIPEEPILKDFNLHIAAGENIALVGHTGAGKSSLAKLVTRFYEFQSGDLQIDGQDIRSLDLHSYRSQLGIVSQTPFLFDGSVAENIRYAQPDASDRQILTLAHQIGDGEWMEVLPQGLDTQVGERGGRLSMGQRQLVALLRVLVQKPGIFILDEATASIDPFTEAQIQQALSLILAETTSIMIAHRLSTVKAADRILVLDHGRILESGNHDTLLQLQGYYAELYNTYFRHQSLTYIEDARRQALGS